MPANANPSPAEIVAALQRGGIAEALKLALAAKASGSSAAKTVADRGATQPEPFKSPPLSSTRPDLSPGEVPRSSSDIWLILLLTAALSFIYYFFGR